MAAYILASYDIDDPAGYEAYVPAVIPLLQKHGAEVVVADYDVQSIEGTARKANVVLRFESEEAAMGWYNDPDYGPAKDIRLAATSNATMILAKQFVMPSS